MNFIKNPILYFLNLIKPKAQKIATARNVFGMDLFADEPQLLAQLRSLANKNAKLVDSLPKNQFKKLAGIIERGLRQGERFETVAKEIEKVFGIAQEYALSIARNQTSKLNASLTQFQQQELGIETFTWLTCGDERVRESHRVLDGKLCKWDDSTIFFDETSKKWVPKKNIGGDPYHPGHSENCRCIASPNLEGLLSL